ncbi:dicer-like protein 1 [Plakobranchus ocellatus]|uniref:Dicer-like protein 1 n=1 Tax=Plakobranchus ocellatus TaxID=259542 RepID=A0AAV4AUA7_9GAST|nr:dicer-like protein 1 [Plakobranchus ocellatus]
MLADALVSWLSRCGENDLIALNAKKFTSSNVPEDEGGMTESDQRTVLEQFHTGEVKVLVSTSVAEEGLDIRQCNIVIKYNHIGNEVSKVQTQGRSRTFGGVSILLAFPDILERERMNCLRAELMKKALDKIGEKNQAEFRRAVNEYQSQLFLLWDLAEREEALRRLQMRDVPFKVQTRTQQVERHHPTEAPEEQDVCKIREAAEASLSKDRDA